MPDRRENAWFDGWCRHNGLIPQLHSETELGDIFIADSEDTVTNEDGETVFRSCFIIWRNGIKLANIKDYEAASEPLLTRRGFLQKRIEDRKEIALMTLSAWVSTDTGEAFESGRNLTIN